MGTGPEVPRGSSKFHQKTGLGRPTFVSECKRSARAQGLRTFIWTIEPDVELLHAVVDQRDFVI